MSKRSADAVEDGNQAYLKRQRVANTVKTANTSIDIQSARQLKQILAFDQDSGRSKHGIQSLKAFLDSFSAPDANNAARTTILGEYLESQKPSEEDDKTAIYLSDIMQTWSFASQANDESLLSAVPAVLALLLKTLSSILELADYGLRLGRTILQKRQLELVARGLTSNKSKEHIISPVLRLLRELASYDGGTLSKQVFKARDFTFKNMARNLSLKYTGEGVEVRRKPSVRTNSIRFVLAVLKFLPLDAKRELLSQKDVVMGLTRDIRDDPPFMIRDVLEVLKTSVLQDEALPRDAKSKVVNSTSLGRVAMLYGYDQAEDEVDAGKKPVNQVAHEFLTVACTSPNLGVLNRQNGFYPRGVDPDENHTMYATPRFIDLGIDSIEWMTRFTEKVPVRNTILSDFIQNLRPWSNLKQSELLLSILKSAPELVADYFFNMKSFSLDPKLTTTWIGYSAFVFSAVQLPLPKYFGHPERYARLPPPSSIVLENLLPQPLTQKVLTRCLNQSHNLISFFAVRVLVIALNKLQEALKMYYDAAAVSSPIWGQGAVKLRREFGERVPSIKDVIGMYRKLSDTDLMQKEAVTRLIVLYFDVIPRVALDAKFDVSDTLSKAVRAIEGPDLSAEDRVLRIMELENLFMFACYSPGMKWFTKTEGLGVSPFMAMLKLCAEAPADIPLVNVRFALDRVNSIKQILQSRTSISALESLVLRLRNIPAKSNKARIYTFLDDCISRCAATPLKYLFNLEDICPKCWDKTDPQGTICMMTLAITEQWPFLIKSDTEHLDDVAEFIAHFLAASIKIGEDKKVIKSLTKSMVESTPKDLPARKVIAKCRKLVEDVEVPIPKEAGTVIPEPPQESESEEAGERSLAVSEEEKNEVEASMLEKTYEEDHSSLVKWTTKEIEEVIEAGHCAALVMLLSSQHFSVRKEALTNISKLAAKLKESSYEEKDQIWLLLCELVETAKKIIDQEPLPTIISAFASHSIAVLSDPLHFLYPKVNKFLSQGPTWQVDKIPLMYKIIDEGPSLDDCHWKEVSWLLVVMHDGLRTPTDMGIFRKRRAFEKILTLYNNVYLPFVNKTHIIKILFRATTIEGGSTTLITRFSILSWVRTEITLRPKIPETVLMKVLLKRIQDTCDQKRVAVWERGGKIKEVEE